MTKRNYAQATKNILLRFKSEGVSQVKRATLNHKELEAICLDYVRWRDLNIYANGQKNTFENWMQERLNEPD